MSGGGRGATVVLILTVAGVASVGYAAAELSIRGASLTTVSYPVALDAPEPTPAAENRSNGFALFTDDAVQALGLEPG